MSAISGDAKECYICLDEDMPGPFVAHRAEGSESEPLHLAHKKCLSEWLEKNSSCGVCREKIDASSTASKVKNIAKNLVLGPFASSFRQTLKVQVLKNISWAWGRMPLFGLAYEISNLFRKSLGLENKELHIWIAAVVDELIPYVLFAMEPGKRYSEENRMTFIEQYENSMFTMVLTETALQTLQSVIELIQSRTEGHRLVEVPSPKAEAPAAEAKEGDQ